MVSGVAISKDDAKITIRNTGRTRSERPRYFMRLQARGTLLVDMIIQNASIEGRADVTFTVPRIDLRLALETAEKIRERP